MQFDFVTVRCFAAKNYAPLKNFEFDMFLTGTPLFISDCTETEVKALYEKAVHLCYRDAKWA